MPSEYDPETRAKAVRLVLKHREDYPSEWAPIAAVSKRLGITPRRCGTGSTGNPRWAEITAPQTRLWGPAFRARRAHRSRDLSWYSTAELQQMLTYLDVPAADRDAHVTITHPDGTICDVAGLGDPAPHGCGCFRRGPGAGPRKS